MKNSKMFYSLAFLWLVFFNIADVDGRQFNEIISFGDSLTDVGNIAGLTVPGVPPVINGYYQETHFSDNVIWIEILADFLGLPARTPGRGSSTSLSPQPDGNDWAWGNSEAAAGFVQPPGVIEPIPNLLTTVSEYLAVQTPLRRTLFSIWSGADNLLVMGDFSPQAARDAVKAVKEAIGQLYRAGGRQFIVFNLPLLGNTPRVQAAGPLLVEAANVYSETYNRALNRTVKRLRANPLFRAKIDLVDVNSEFLRVIKTVNNGRTYVPRFFVPGPPVAINNVTDQGIDFFNMFGTFPPNYLFWDDVHPTTQGHQIVAGLVLKTIKKKKRCGC